MKLLACAFILIVGSQSVSSGDEAACFSLQSGLVFYNITLEDCVDGEVVKLQPVNPGKPEPRTTTLPSTRAGRAPTTKKTSPQTKWTSKRPRPVEGTCTMPAGSKGFQCCGNGIYHPSFQTCCKILSYKYRVHSHMTDKEHICCDLDVYKRSSAVPCRHPAGNDPFYNTRGRRKKMGRNKLKRIAKMATQFEYAYAVHVGDINYRGGYDVEIEQLAGIARNNETQIREMELPRDKYSPKRPKLNGRSFLVLANEDLVYTRLDFILGPKDKVFFVAKGRNGRSKMQKVIRRLKNVCEKYKNNVSKRQRRKKRRSHKYFH